MDDSGNHAAHDVQHVGARGRDGPRRPIDDPGILVLRGLGFDRGGDPDLDARLDGGDLDAAHFGSLSGVVSERVGVVNIAIEGDLLVGAFAGVMAASYFQMPYAGVIAAPLAGAALGALLALFSVKCGVDQIIVGVVLNVLALGLTTFLYGTVMKETPGSLNTNQFSLSPIKIPGLAEIPVIGPVLFNQTILVYLMYAAVIALAFFLFRSRWGLRLRACGEHPRAADTVGINVGRTRTLNTILGSAFAGLGGAFFTIGSGLAFTDNISAGNGYIALAAMILGKWNPVGAMGAAVMFGFAQALARMLPNIEPATPRRPGLDDPLRGDDRRGGRFVGSLARPPPRTSPT